MTEQEIMDTVEQRIRERFARVQLRGAGGVAVDGGNGRFVVSIAQDPAQLSPDVTVEPDIGLEPFTVFCGEFNGGDSKLVLNFGGSINGVPWMYDGQALSSVPHPVIDLNAGVRIYGVVTFTTANVALHTRGSPSGPTGNWMGATVCTSAELVLKGYSEAMAADVGNPGDADNPGGFSIHWLFARYNSAGDNVPITDPTDPDYGLGYGWLGFFPFAPFGLTKMNSLAYNS